MYLPYHARGCRLGSCVVILSDFLDFVCASTVVGDLHEVGVREINCKSDGMVYRTTEVKAHWARCILLQHLTQREAPETSLHLSEEAIERRSGRASQNSFVLFCLIRPGASALRCLGFDCGRRGCHTNMLQGYFCVSL